MASNAVGNSGYSNEFNATTQSPVITNFSFTSVGDARVDSTNPTTNYGSDVAIGVHESTGRTMNSYVQFNVSGLTGPVTGAKLRLKESPTGTSSLNNGAMGVRVVTGPWTESSVTWNNRPSYGATTLGTVPANSVGQDSVVEISLDPAAFSADGTYSLAVIGTSDGNDVPFIAREAGADAPELILTVGALPEGENLSFESTADTFVSESAPTTNFGNEGRVSIYEASGSRRRGYLRFEVSGLAGVSVQSVALDLVERFESTDAAVGFEIRKVTGPWTESGLTWNTQPSIGSTSYGTFTPEITTVFTVPSNGKVMAAPNTYNGMRVRVDLDPSLITGDGVYELALIPVSGWAPAGTDRTSR